MGSKKRLNWKTACSISDSYALVLIFCLSCHLTHSSTGRLSRVWSRPRLSFYPVKTVHKADERWLYRSSSLHFSPCPSLCCTCSSLVFLEGVMAVTGDPGRFEAESFISWNQTNRSAQRRKLLHCLKIKQVKKDRQAHKGGEKRQIKKGVWNVNPEWWNVNPEWHFSTFPKIFNDHKPFFSLSLFFFCYNPFIFINDFHMQQWLKQYSDSEQLWRTKQ